MSQTTTTTTHTPLIELAGHLMKQCACGGLFNAEIPGDRCSACGGPSLHPAPEWVDGTAEYRAIFPSPIDILAEAHFGMNRRPRR